MKNIQADIKSGNFKQVYLLYGEEAYLKQQYKQNLVKALNPDGDTMNFNHYEGKGIDVKQLIDLCETMPFFAERRVVLLEDTGFFKNKCEELADYMKELPDYLYLVFAETEVDKRNRMYKAVKACGSIAEFIRQDEKTLMRWAAGILGKAGKKITLDIPFSPKLQFLPLTSRYLSVHFQILKYDHICMILPCIFCNCPCDLSA